MYCDVLKLLILLALFLPLTLLVKKGIRLDKKFRTLWDIIRRLVVSGQSTACPMRMLRVAGDLELKGQLAIPGLPVKWSTVGSRVTLNNASDYRANGLSDY